MGQAFDCEGNMLGEAFGDSKREVFDKLSSQFKDAHEIRIKTLKVDSEMPRYRCHKEVHALKIVGVQLDAADARAENRETDGSALLLMEAPFAGIRVTAEWIRKHAPVVGGYYVVYKDGYASFSPAEAFDDGYTKITD